MKKSIFLLLFGLCTIAGKAQSGGDIEMIANLPKIIPPSPNSAALEKFGVIPVDYSTGVPNISYPMWSWQRGKFSFSIGLNYHAGGHKVDDMAPNTGLGWALTGAPRISRTVRGLNDDDVVKGFMYTPVLPQVTTYAYDGGYYPSSQLTTIQENEPVNKVINKYNAPYSGTIQQIVESQLDAEQDIFSYTTNGSSGRFIIDKNRHIVPLEHTNVKIEMVCNPTNIPDGTAGKIIAFRITDDKGVVYNFEHQEFQSAIPVNDAGILQAGPPPQNYASGWLLSNMSDPTTNDLIVFNYIDNNVNYEGGFSESQSYELRHYQNGNGLPGVNKISDVYSFIKMGNNEPMLRSVNFPDGTAVVFGYNFDRDDLHNGKAMTSVVIRDYQHAIVKQFRLNYSYFMSGAGTNFPLWSTSGNDYNKRLRLDNIEELSVDGMEAKTTVFTYNATMLNPRGSKNIDFWGYNVNPSRNNAYYVPRIEMDPTDVILNPDYGKYLEGADRKPDADYMKAAVLEKVQYPTGGYSQFTYEINQAFSDINYYENRLQTSTLEWNQLDFGSAQPIFFSNVSGTDVEFHFKTIEFGPRPVPDPNAPQTCFNEQQDMQLGRFVITSTDNSFSTYVEDTYGHFFGGITRTLSLPADKLYTIKFEYNAGSNCAYMYPFKAQAYGVYTTPLRDKMAGGLRIKKIVSNDGIKDAITKEYEYANEDGYSSATLTNIPDFSYYRSTLDNSIQGCTCIVIIPHVNRISSPTQTINYFNGSPLIYKRVIEKELDGSVTERRYDSVVYSSNGGTGFYPYLPSQDFPNLSGLLLKQIIKDKDGNKKVEETHTYNKFKVYLLNEDNRNVKTGTVATAVEYNVPYYVADQYFMYTSRAEEATVTTVTYEGANSLMQQVTKQYDPTMYYLRSTETTTSKGGGLHDDYFYPFDYSDPAMLAMVQKNIISPVVGTTRSKLPLVVNNGLFRKQTNYQLWQNGLLPMPSTEQNALYGNTLETVLTYDDYDDKGNIRQYTAKDGVITSFIWGYNQQYPVAKIIGTSYQNAITQSNLNMSVLNSPSDDNTLRAELNKLYALPGCQVTTYTYRHDVGISSETSVNNITTYYEYDIFNRLLRIRDKDNRILKQYDYKYQQNAGTLFVNVAKSATITKNDCSGNTVGSSVTYTIAAGTYTSHTSQAEADQLAQNAANAGVQANANTYGTCTVPCSPACNTPFQKCIDGSCKRGLKIYTSSEFESGVGYHCTYHYSYPDGTISDSYTEISSTDCSLPVLEL